MYNTEFIYMSLTIIHRKQQKSELWLSQCRRAWRYTHNFKHLSNQGNNHYCDKKNFAFTCVPYLSMCHIKLVVNFSKLLISDASWFNLCPAWFIFNFYTENSVSQNFIVWSAERKSWCENETSFNSRYR